MSTKPMPPDNDQFMLYDVIRRDDIMAAINALIEECPEIVQQGWDMSKMRWEAQRNHETLGG